MSAMRRLFHKDTNRDFDLLHRREAYALEHGGGTVSLQIARNFPGGLCVGASFSTAAG